jgi:CubicO group peptidase (beta-lactamase class C family)
VRDRDLVTPGAGGIYSTTADMARYMAALLAGGCGEHGQILKPNTVASMFAPHYQPDPRLPAIGLAFFRRDLGGHLLAGHDGLVPGFTSQMSLAPDDGTRVIAFTNGARGAMAWLGPEVTAILGHSLGVPDPVIRADVPHCQCPLVSDRAERQEAGPGWLGAAIRRGTLACLGETIGPAVGEARCGMVG